jgi:hypothetical protein
MNGDVDDVTPDTMNPDVDDLFSDLLNTTNSNAVTDQQSYQVPVVDTSLVPTKESELPFNLEGPSPQIVNFNWTYLTFSPSTELT